MNEIAAAGEVELERLTPQHQLRLVNEPSLLDGAQYDALRAALRALAKRG